MHILTLRLYTALFILLFSQFIFAQQIIGDKTIPAVEIPNSPGYKNSNGVLIPSTKPEPVEKMKNNVVVDGLDIYANSRQILIPIKVQELDGAMALTDPQADPSAIDLFRHAISQEATKEHLQNERDGFFRSANKRLAPESATFFLATGLVIWETAFTTFDGDPLAMERHILSLKDPIATASFYAFMQANGFYMQSKAAGLPRNLDPQTRAQMMRRFSYGGMVWGSLASSLLSDIFAPFKPCLEKMFTKDYRFTADLEEKCQMNLNMAWKQWTTRNKFGQYAPQILSLILSQKAAEMTTAVAGVGMKRLTATEAVKTFANSPAAKKFIYEITGVDALFTLVPGRWPVITFRWLTKLTQFTMFMAIDHKMSASIYRSFNNVYKPTAFHFDAMKIDRLWNLADTYGWDDSNTLKDKSHCPVQIPDCMVFSDLPKEIENFSAQTQQWREHINAENEQELAGWMEMTKKILNQVGLTYEFYKSYLNNLFDTLNVGERIRTGQSPAKVINDISRFPYRELPLYGVRLKTESKEIPARDQYLLSPQHMEEYQIAHIQDILTSVNSDAYLNLKIMQLNKKAQDRWEIILNRLQSNDLNQIANALVEINTIAGIYGEQKQQKAGFISDVYFTNFLIALRTAFGNPLPILYKGAGLSQAFADFGPNLQTAREANFSWRGNTYGFNKDSDYLTYQMICGNAKGVLTNNWLFTDDFVPPRILNENSKPVQFCNSTGTFISSDSLYTIALTDEKTRKSFSSVTDYITEHLNYSQILGDYRNKRSKSQFDKWWMTDVKENIRPRFKDFDERFKVLVSKNRDTLLGINTPLTTKVIDTLFNWGDYLPESILASFRWELEVYLELLQSVSKSKSPQWQNKNFPFMKTISKNVKDEVGLEVYGKRVVELQELKKMFNQYFILLPQNEVTFEQYREFSKKIKDQIELIKERIGGSETAQQHSLNSPTINKNEATEIEKISYSLTPTKHKVALAAIQGLELLEAEMRRFLRMKLLLSQTLDIDIKEYMGDTSSDDKSQKGVTGVQSAAQQRKGL